MPWHDWSDPWFEKHGNTLYKAQGYIHDYVYKWSWCRLMSKEKYGTIRYEWVLPPGGRLSGIKHISLPFPLFHKKIKIGNGEIIKGHIVLWSWQSYYSWTYRKWEQFGWWMTDIAIEKACKKWPEVSKELRADRNWRWNNV